MALRGVHQGLQAQTLARQPPARAAGIQRIRFYAQPGDTINFGSLVLSSFIFGDGRQLQSTQYIDENGQLQWTYGTPTAVYSGSLAVSEIYRPFLQLNYSWDGICNSGVPSCFPFPQSRMTSRTVDLVFTLTTGFIKLGWTSPATYIAPTSIGPVLAEAVPEPSTWAMMFLGFAGIGYMTYRRRKTAALAA